MATSLNNISWKDAAIPQDRHSNELYANHYYITSCKFFFFTPALADGLSLEFEKQQVYRTILNILADEVV